MLKHCSCNSDSSGHKRERAGQVVPAWHSSPGLDPTTATHPDHRLPRAIRLYRPALLSPAGRCHDVSEEDVRGKKRGVTRTREREVYDDLWHPFLTFPPLSTSRWHLHHPQAARKPVSLVLNEWWAAGLLSRRDIRGDSLSETHQTQGVRKCTHTHTHTHTHTQKKKKREKKSVSDNRLQKQKTKKRRRKKRFFSG